MHPVSTICVYRLCVCTYVHTYPPPSQEGGDIVAEKRYIDRTKKGAINVIVEYNTSCSLDIFLTI
jgi:hypothetical protein